MSRYRRETAIAQRNRCNLYFWKRLHTISVIFRHEIALRATFHWSLLLSPTAKIANFSKTRLMARFLASTLDNIVTLSCTPIKLLHKVFSFSSCQIFTSENRFAHLLMIILPFRNHIAILEEKRWQTGLQQSPRYNPSLHSWQGLYPCPTQSLAPSYTSLQAATASRLHAKPLNDRPDICSPPHHWENSRVS